MAGVMSLAAGTLLPVAPSALADVVGNPAEGRHIADQWCLSCHVVAPDAKRGASTGAPTFQAIAQTKSLSQPALRAFLQTPHDRMPDLHLTRQEIDSLTAYILSLRVEQPDKGGL
jgi:cytochrome c